MDVTELHRRAVEHWRHILDRVEPGQWSQSTPCTDWDVRALVNHVVGEELWTKPLMEGATIADVGNRFDGDVVGDDPIARGNSTATEAAEAVDTHAPKGGMVNVSWGQIPAEEYVRQLAADHLIHGWDLAAATGQPRDLDPELLAEVAQWFAPNEEMIRSAGVIAEHQALTGDPQTELLAAYGRRADWSA